MPCLSHLRWEELRELASSPSDTHVFFAEHFSDAVNGLFTTLTTSSVCTAVPSGKKKLTCDSINSTIWVYKQRVTFPALWNLQGVKWSLTRVFRKPWRQSKSFRETSCAGRGPRDTQHTHPSALITGKWTKTQWTWGAFGLIEVYYVY